MIDRLLATGSVCDLASFDASVSLSLLWRS